MMITIPSEDAIRAMDGATLTELAWALEAHPALRCPLSDEGIARFLPGPWEPYQCLAQAEVVFRDLRAQGWMLSNSWRPMLPPARRGYLEAIQGLAHIGVHYGLSTEAHALLLVSVLAHAHAARRATTQGDARCHV
jgi:hypothetical protein